MKVKKRYCTNCKRFKRVCRVSSGFMGYPDTYHCRHCGTELVRVSEILNLLIKEKIDEITKNSKEEGRKIGY